jgi:hypothetical protein
MHRFQGHFFDLTNITSGTSNFDLTPLYNIWWSLNIKEVLYES